MWARRNVRGEVRIDPSDGGEPYWIQSELSVETPGREQESFCSPRQSRLPPQLNETCPETQREVDSASLCEVGGLHPLLSSGQPGASCLFLQSQRVIFCNLTTSEQEGSLNASHLESSWQDMCERRSQVRVRKTAYSAWAVITNSFVSNKTWYVLTPLSTAWVDTGKNDNSCQNIHTIAGRNFLTSLGSHFIVPVTRALSEMKLPSPIWSSLANINSPDCL